MSSRIIKFCKNPYKIIDYLGAKVKLKCFPDEVYLKILYRARMGKKLNIINPKTFNEKLQWLKLYDRDPLYTNLVDKYEVRKYIAEAIGEEYLVPLIGVWNSFDEIDFSKLPNKFVLKCTHDSGGVIICKDKSKLKINSVIKSINRKLKRNYYYYGREWPYKNIKPRIIAEKFMGEWNKDLKDYKFFCFNGEPKLILVCSERYRDTGLKETFFDTAWNITNIKRPGHSRDINIHKPTKLDEMLSLSKKLSEGKSFIRVDFYEINGQVYFGELTFYPASGFTGFKPEKYDEILGGWIEIPEGKH